MNRNAEVRNLIIKLLAWPLGAVILGIVLLTLSITMPGDSGNAFTVLFRTLFGIIHFPILLSQNFLGWPTGGIGFVVGFALDGLLWFGVFELVWRFVMKRRRSARKVRGEQ